MIQFLKQLSAKHAIGAGLFFTLLNILFIVTENYWGLVIPFLIAVVALVVLALDKVLLFIIFATPLSILYFNEKLGVGFTLPTEPLLFGIMILFFAKVLFRGGFDRKVALHPISIAILLNLIWLFFTSITSELPLVSFKYFLARLWFVSVFFYLMSQLFLKPENIYRFFWLYMIPLAGVVIYTLTIHVQWGLTREASVWVMYPFFKEHTVYGAVLAMYIPVAFAFGFLLNQSLNRKLLGSLLFVILVAGVIFSFTRAAWVSLAAATAAAVLILAHTKKWMFYLMVLVFLGGVYHYKDDLLQKFEKNEATSSDNLTEHVESISNISSDPSNMERINRWKSAFRMFAERPLTGFGPGTYMFLYAPYQKPHEKTIISTNAGDLGNAHSEYIGPLAESGVPGLLTIALLVYFTITTGIRVFYGLKDQNLKILSLMIIMGLITYWTHGFLNNFLDMDKASLPVFGFTALLVVLELYYLPKKKN